MDSSIVLSRLTRERHNPLMGVQAASLIGRDEELQSVQTFLGGVERGPSALVLAGEAGIGKTMLWEHGLRAAEQDVGHVLTCRGVEAEASLSFAALSDLLSPALVEAMPLLASPRRRALEVAKQRQRHRRLAAAKTGAHLRDT